MASTAVVPEPKATENKNKRVDWKKQKELEEARKAGTAPPEVDEEGRYGIQNAALKHCFRTSKFKLFSTDPSGCFRIKMAICFCVCFIT